MPLSAVAHYEPTTAPIAVNHQSQFPSVTLSFNLAPGLALSDAVKAIQQMERTDWHAGPRSTEVFPARYRRSRRRWPTEPFLILTALLAVYIVLGILYESFIHPDHDFVHAAVGGRRRGAGADALSHRS